MATPRWSSVSFPGRVFTLLRNPPIPVFVTALWATLRALTASHSSLRGGGRNHLLKYLAAPTGPRVCITAIAPSVPRAVRGQFLTVMQDNSSLLAPGLLLLPHATDIRWE